MAAYADNKDEPLWLIASEYVIGEVNHVTYPNRVLRQAGLLKVREEADGEHLDLAGSTAWAMVDHQLSHVYVRGGAEQIARVKELFAGLEGIDEALSGDELSRYDLNHANCGEVVLISTPTSWQAYYWWLDNARAPKIRPHCRHPSQAGLRSGRIAFRLCDEEHSARRHADQRIARRAGSRAMAARRAVDVAAGGFRRPADGRHRRVRPGAATVRDLNGPPLNL